MAKGGICEDCGREGTFVYDGVVVDVCEHDDGERVGFGLGRGGYACAGDVGVCGCGHHGRYVILHMEFEEEDGTNAMKQGTRGTRCPLRSSLRF